MSILVRKVVALPETVDPKTRECALPDGFPFLLDEDTGEVIEPALFFLTDHCLRGRKTFNPCTAAAYAYDLRDWWAYLTHYRIEWGNASRDDVAHYCEEMSTSISPATHKPYSVMTVRRRIVTVSAFYRWAQKGGHVEGIGDALSATKIVVRAIDSNALAHTGSSHIEVPANTVGPRAPRTVSDSVQVLYPNIAKRLFHELGPLPSKQNSGDMRPSRDRLCAELGICSGMRIDERLKLTVYQIESLPYDPHSEGCCFLKITMTKRSKPRTVRVPQWLLGELLAYIDGEREAALRKGKLDKRKDKAAALFLNGCDADSSVGLPLKYDNWNRIFNSAQHRAGLVRKERFTDPETKENYKRKVPQYQDRDLRHTYAVMRYYVEKYTNNNPEPWLVIKQELGHAHVQTTLDIYLRVASDYEREVGAAYMARLQELLGR